MSRSEFQERQFLQLKLKELQALGCGSFRKRSNLIRRRVLSICVVGQLLKKALGYLGI